MKKRPNIVIFNPDHYRSEALGHRGNECVHSPNLDRLAGEDAVSFSNAFCQNPVCTPSRCCFMTGWYPHVRGHRTMFHMLRDDEPDLLSRLKEAGYFVWWGGKNDLVPAQHGFEKYCHVKHKPESALKTLPKGWRGDPSDSSYFSFFHGKIEKDIDEEVYYDFDWAHILGAIDQINNLPEDKPFCLYLPLMYPHPPFAVEEPFFSMVDRTKVPERIPTPQNWKDKASMLKGTYDRSKIHKFTEKQWTELRAVYYGMCSRVDHQFGMIVNALKKANLYDDTALFFFSDHGVYAGDYGLPDINQNSFEDSLTKVPFIIKPPTGVEIKAGVNDSLVELTDLVATVEELTGLEKSHSHFGRSLVPLMKSGTSEHRQAVFCEGGRLHGENQCMELEYLPGHQDPENLYYPRLSLQAEEGPEHTKATMCRTKKYKYIRRFYEKDELYDLQKDPQELSNLIDNPAYMKVIGELKELLLNWYMESCDNVPFDPDSRF